MSFVVVQRGCAHLLLNTISQESPWQRPPKPWRHRHQICCSPRGYSAVIDWPALSCFDAMDTTREFVKQSDQMTAPRKKGVRFADPNDCVRDKVCSAGVPRAGIAAHHVETTTGTWTKSRSRRVVQPRTHDQPPACLLELQSSGFRSSCCSAQRIAASLQTSSIMFFSWVSADAAEQLLCDVSAL